LELAAKDLNNNAVLFVAAIFSPLFILFIVLYSEELGITTDFGGIDLIFYIYFGVIMLLFQFLYDLLVSNCMETAYGWKLNAYMNEARQAFNDRKAIWILNDKGNAHQMYSRLNRCWYFVLGSTHNTTTNTNTLLTHFDTLSTHFRHISTDSPLFPVPCSLFPVPCSLFLSSFTLFSDRPGTEHIEKNLRGIHKMAFSNQFYFVASALTYGSLLSVYGAVACIYNGYQLYRDNLMIPLIVFMIVICWSVEVISVKLARVMKLWFRENEEGRLEVLEIQKQKVSSSSAGGGDTNDALLNAPNAPNAPNADEDPAVAGDEIDTNLQYRALTRIGVKKSNFQMFDKQLEAIHDAPAGFTAGEMSFNISTEVFSVVLQHWHANWVGLQQEQNMVVPAPGDDDGEEEEEEEVSLPVCRWLYASTASTGSA